ncbi:winged helix-turn-helix domain-containing protein [Brevibacterium sp. BRM-1]|uniref:winged helix-turn-helix domain-containing protein n=1 Tax=Brevibacterium sp. BRM-1 TaxID=2999062 RepID=UPI002E111EE2
MRVLHIAPAGGSARSLSLEALDLLPHTIHRTTSDHAELLRSPECDVAVFDATAELSQAAGIVARLDTVGLRLPVVIALSEGGLAAANPAWGAADIVFAGAGVAEVDARLRLARRVDEQPDESGGPTTIGGITVDEDSYTATAGDRGLDLTYKEFELLKFLTQNPGRVFSRAQLLQDVWGYDYYGGTRTVDVHVRRLRAKLGPELEASIFTVRNVGYRFSPDFSPEPDDDPPEEQEHDDEQR